MRLAPLDWVAILASLALLVASSLFARTSREGELTVVVTGQETEWVYPLEEDREIAIPGPLGTTIVEIHDGHVHIASSPCPNQTCVAVAAINLPGQWVACLPNQVFVRIEGKTTDDSVDANVF